MRPWLLAIVLGYGTAVAQQPQVASRGKVVEVTIPAPSLAGNLLGDPVEQGAAIYLPAGYQTATSKRYPVVYLLHGIGDTYEVWLGHFQVPQLLDDLIAAGQIPPTIGVGTREFSEELAEARIPHSTEMYAGDHRQKVTERLRTIVFPFFGQTLVSR